MNWYADFIARSRHKVGKRTPVISSTDLTDLFEPAQHESGKHAGKWGIIHKRSFLDTGLDELVRSQWDTEAEARAAIDAHVNEGLARVIERHREIVEMVEKGLPKLQLALSVYSETMGHSLCILNGDSEHVTTLQLSNGYSEKALSKSDIKRLLDLVPKGSSADVAHAIVRAFDHGYETGESNGRESGYDSGYEAASDSGW